MAKFDARSEKNLKTLHPDLQKVHREAIKSFAYIITDGRRNEIDQTRAYKTGKSKVRFGNSAHNYTPAVASDCYPAPFNPKESVKRMIELYRVLLAAAKKVGVAVRQGADFDRDGNLTNDPWDDLPHIELHPWRTIAKRDCQLYKG